MALFNKNKLKSYKAEKEKAEAEKKTGGLVLIVDDEPANIDVLKGVLGEHYEVITALSGELALSSIAGLDDATKLSLIISDQRMPNMTGVELLEQASKIVPDAVRILLTGYSDMDAIADAINRAQIYRYLTKPFNRHDMLLTIKAALETVQSVQAKKIAEAESRARTDFLATMSHEIRTPLNGVVGMLALLQKTSLSAVQKRFVQDAQFCSETLLGLINNILDLSKLDTDSTEIERSDFDLSELVVGISKALALRAIEKNVDVVISFDPTAHKNVVSDATRLKQILTNLVGNAIKFTDTGAVIIRVSETSRSEGRSTYQFEVIDSGIGIAEENLDKVFQAYAQADGSTSAKYGGTGLGLAISQKLVRLLGGEIKIESSLGSGSRFYFSLPMAISAGVAGTSVTEKCGWMPRVMAIIDNSKVACELERILAGITSANSVFPTGDALLDAFEGNVESSGLPDICIIDENISDMGPEMIANIIKNEPSLKDIKLLFLAKPSVLGDAHRIEEWGFNGLLIKPLNALDVMEAINRFRDSDGDFVTVNVDNQPNIQASVKEFPNSKVLVVDDGSINRAVAQGLLEGFGCSVAVAENGKIAIQNVSAEPFDLIFMDCRMPEMDGFEATKQIRAMDESIARVPIVALTANATKADQDECLAAGMDGFLSKPIRPELLEETLAQYLGKYLVESAKQPGTSATEAVDEIDSVAKRLGDKYQSMANLFLAQTKEKIMEMEQSLENNDSDALRDLAHFIAGSAGSIGFVKMRKTAKCVEDNIATLDRDSLSEYIGKLNIELREFKSIASQRGLIK